MSNPINYEFSEAQIKKSRLCAFLDAQGLDGVLLSRRSTFAWYTGGARNHIFLASETGAASLLVTRESTILIAHTMDGRRMMNEEVPDQGITLRAHRWYEDRGQALAELCQGKRIGCDIPTAGLQLITSPWREVYFPLLPAEIARAKSVARLSDEAISEAATGFTRGCSERQLAGLLARSFTERGLEMDVLLVGADERPFHYRHCLPTERPVTKNVLLHVAAQRYGLHANLTRIVHFGAPPSKLQHAHQALGTIFATILAQLKPGYRLADLLPVIKQCYHDCGYGEEWREHFQGGIAGYEACEPLVMLDASIKAQRNQLYDWLPSLPGTKIEESSLLGDDRADLISVGPSWPTFSVEVAGRSFNMPAILQR